MAKRHLVTPALILTAILVWAVPSASAAAAWQQPIAGEEGGLESAVAMDASGNAYAAWSTAGDLRFSIRPGGATFQPAMQISPVPVASNNVGSGPQIATDAVGNVTVAWCDGSGTLKIATHAPGEQTIPAVQTIATDASPGTRFNLQVAPSGAAVIAYSTSGRSVRVAIRPAAGQSFGAPEDPGVTLAGSAADAPNAYILDDGTVGVVCSPQGDGVRAAVRDPAGTWDVETLATFLHAGEAAIALLPDGTALVAYVDDSGQIHVKTRPRGGDFSGSEALSLPGTASADFLQPLQLKLDATGNATIAWRQNEQVWVVSRPVGGTLGTPAAIAGSGPAEYVRLALDAAGTALVSWRSGDGHSDAPRTPGAVFASVAPFSSSTQLAPDGAYAPAIAAGPAGSGLVVWSHAASSTCTQIESSVLADGVQGPLTGLAPSCPPPPAPQTPPTSGGAGTTNAPVADHRGPRLKFSKTKQRFAKKGVITLRISCDENCSGVVIAKIQHTPGKAGRAAKAKKMRGIHLSTAKFHVRGGHHTTIRYKLTAGQVTAIKKMLTKQGRATFVASVVATDGSGNKTRAKAHLKLVH